MSRTKFIAYTAVFTALVAVITYFPSFPLPANRGFINFGDAIIFVTGILFGPFSGMIAGGIGSSIADLLLGYAIWAPFTFVIKGAEGAVVGLVYLVVSKMLKPKLKFLAYIIAMVAAGLVMIAGYFFATAIIVKSFAVAAVGIIESLIQISVSIVIASLILGATKSIMFAINKRER